MIRRGFWIAVGAAGGIMGYRRVARVTKRAWARETIRFTRDVLDGMDLYMARHPGRLGPTLGASSVVSRGDDPPDPLERTHNDEDEKDDR
jgi:hypothetical protein